MNKKTRWSLKRSLARIEFKLDLLLADADINPEAYIQDPNVVSDIPEPEETMHCKQAEYRKPSSKEPRAGRFLYAHRRKRVRALYK